MGNETYDLFLVLTRRDGRAVPGESNDQGLADQSPIELNDFSFAVEKPSYEAAKTSGSKKDDKVNFDSFGTGDTIADKKKKADQIYEKARQRLQLLESFQEQGDKDARKVKRSRTFSVKKGVDQSSVELFRAFCENLSLPESGGGGSDGDKTTGVKPSIFSKATVYVRKAGGFGDSIYLTYEFENLNVEHYKLDISDTEHDEDVHFTFDKVTITYRPQSESGEVGKTPGDLVVMDFQNESKGE